MKEYKGWFWFCPVFYEPKTQKLSPRFKIDFLFPMEITLFMHHSMLVISDFFGLDVEPVYPIRINKK